MTEPGTEATAAEWRRLVRRAYYVPDIVRDEAAIEYLGARLTMLVVGDERPDDPSPLPAQVLRELFAAGGQGRLDGYLIEVPGFSGKQLEAEITQKVGCAQSAVEDIIADVITRVKALVLTG